jgi:hypothetical protein
MALAAGGVAHDGRRLHARRRSRLDVLDVTP